MLRDSSQYGKPITILSHHLLADSDAALDARVSQVNHLTSTHRPALESQQSTRTFTMSNLHRVLEEKKVKVGVLGATGTVGQRFITLLANHPWFTIHALGASPRSAGKAYPKAVNWKQTSRIPSIVRETIVQECQPEHFKDCAIVFSGLDAEVAGEIGEPMVGSCPPRRDALTRSR